MPAREEIVRTDKEFVWHPYTAMGPYIDSFDPVVVERAEGIYLHDPNGRRLIDGNSSWWVALLGHNHPRLVAALKKQADAFCHCALAGIAHAPAAELARELVQKCGGSYSRLFDSDDGSTAVEVAIRMALQYAQLKGDEKRTRFVSLSGAFHGETVGAASVSGNQTFHGALNTLMFECMRLPTPARAAFNPNWRDELFESTEKLLREKGDEICAVIVEPLVQGAAGMLMYSPEYLTRLYELTRELGILLIADEVFVGYGRTGTFLATQQASIEADILCLAKGFSGGILPMAATVTTEEIFEQFRGGADRTLWYGHSFTGNPLGAAVGLEVLRTLEEEKIIDGLEPKCAALQSGLDGVEAHPWVRDIRRTGMIAAFTLIEPGADGESDYLNDAGWRFYAEALKRGALLRPLGNVVYFVLPLTITTEQINDLFAIVTESLTATFGE